MAVFKDSTKRK